MASETLRRLGVAIPEIYVPRAGVDLRKWAVVACDQHTSEPEYWEAVEGEVGECPSTLRLVFPEAYLGQGDEAERIAAIQSAMHVYLREGLLERRGPGLVCVDRTTARGARRRGLVLALDLECYDYHEGAKSLIRATEGTVESRLPPRMRIRRNAALEFPHIMVLIDDPDRTVVEPLAEAAEGMAPLYETDLMLGGGHVRGTLVEDERLIERMAGALGALADPERFREHYGGAGGADVLLFAMGDGNHSLATAKVCWEELKGTLPREGLGAHPARHALVEVVNVHDEGLTFEPIHRLVKGTDPDRLLGHMAEWFQRKGSVCFADPVGGREEMASRVEELRQREPGAHCLGHVLGDGAGVIAVRGPKQTIEAGTLQEYLDDYARLNSDARIDYIHGEEALWRLAAAEGSIGFVLPALSKAMLFPTILREGALPRKTFSMGEAEEKRYYLEGRRISPEIR